MQRLVPVVSVVIAVVLVSFPIAAQAPQSGLRGQAAPAKPVGVDAAMAKKMIAAASSTHARNGREVVFG